MSLESGTMLGPYEILSPLGKGGMGEVYRARDHRLDRSVAIKVLRADLTEAPRLRERFEREAKAIASLNHPNICALLRQRYHDRRRFDIPLACLFVAGGLPGRSE